MRTIFIIFFVAYLTTSTHAQRLDTLSCKLISSFANEDSILFQKLMFHPEDNKIILKRTFEQSGITMDESLVQRDSSWDKYEQQVNYAFKELIKKGKELGIQWSLVDCKNVSINRESNQSEPFEKASGEIILQKTPLRKILLSAINLNEQWKIVFVDIVN